MSGDLSWSGVLQPLSADASPIFKLGRTISVKFQLTGACADMTSLLATISLTKINGRVVGLDMDLMIVVGAHMGNTFRYDATDGQ